MADFVDQRIGGFCKDIQKQIDELPFLNQVQKQKFIDMLKECASKTDKAPEDSVAFMRREIRPLANEYQRVAGRFLRVG